MLAIFSIAGFEPQALPPEPADFFFEFQLAFFAFDEFSPLPSFTHFSFRLFLLFLHIVIFLRCQSHLMFRFALYAAFIDYFTPMFVIDTELRFSTFFIVTPVFFSIGR